MSEKINYTTVLLKKMYIKEHLNISQNIYTVKNEDYNDLEPYFKN